MAGVTLGTVITFVGLNKSFTNPITQVSMQVNFVVTAAAGAQRVFDLMDQTPEADEGYVELVNAKEKADGQLEESRRAHQRLGLEASPQGGRHHHLHQAGGRRGL